MSAMGFFSFWVQIFAKIKKLKIKREFFAQYYNYSLKKFAQIAKFITFGL